MNVGTGGRREGAVSFSGELKLFPPLKGLMTKQAYKFHGALSTHLLFSFVKNIKFFARAFGVRLFLLGVIILR